MKQTFPASTASHPCERNGRVRESPCSPFLYALLQLGSGGAVRSFVPWGKWKGWQTERVLSGPVGLALIWMMLLGPGYRVLHLRAARARRAFGRTGPRVYRNAVRLASSVGLWVRLRSSSWRWLDEFSARF